MSSEQTMLPIRGFNEPFNEFDPYSAQKKHNFGTHAVNSSFKKSDRVGGPATMTYNFQQEILRI